MFPGPRPVKTVCTRCNYSCVACMEGDLFFTPCCPRCKDTMDIKPLDNPLLNILIKNLPPRLRRRLTLRCW